jgi:outer membrane protein assembly factor BamE (lipoprotein component of BamABCDE complex)
MLKHLLTFSILPFFAFAQAQTSNEDISQKLDLILQKMADLELRVVKLESSSVKVKQEVQEVAKSAAQARKSIQTIPQEPEEKKSFLQNLGNQLKTQQTLESGPWTQKSTWNEIRKNLSTLQVRKILGNPTKIKKSINPRVDQLFIYSGDLDADGENDQGIVSFYRYRLVDYQSPFE